MARIADLLARQSIGTNGSYSISCEVVLDTGARYRTEMPVFYDYEFVSCYDIPNSRSNIVKSVLKQVFYINNNIKKIIINRDIEDHEIIDEILSRLDKDPKFSNLGINTVSAVSWALFVAAARSKKMDLFKYISKFCGFDNVAYTFPYVVFDIFTDPEKRVIPWKGVGIVPVLKTRFKDVVDFVLRLYEQIIKSKNYIYYTNYDGGLLPYTGALEEILDDIISAAESIGFYNRKDFFLVLDAGLIRTKNNKYSVSYSTDDVTRLELIKYYENLIKKYSLGSIINPIDIQDKEGLSTIIDVLSKDVQIIFDYHYFDDKENIFIFDENVTVGIYLENFLTATSMLNFLSKLKNKNLPFVLRHSLFETTDNFLADIAIATRSIQVDFGGLFGGHNVVKYNRLLTIEEML